MTEVDAYWARDACRCEECRDPNNGQHLFDVASIESLSVVSVQENPEEQLVEVVDGDGTSHTCRIPKDHAIGLGRDSVFWGSEHGTFLKRHNGEASLANFAQELATTGIAIVEGLPTEPGTVLNFARQIGYVRDTNYGQLFDVQTDPNPINLAYTSLGLPLHTDNPYRDPVPTVQLLHCLQPAKTGGASMFCDGFAAAEKLRSDNPEDFEILSSTPLTFRFKSDDTDLRASVPVISVDANDQVARVTVNNRSMEAPAPTADVGQFYKAYQRFVKLLASQAIELTLQAGELVAFDNRRVLHGRSGYPADPSRHLQGCYIDIDSVRSMALIG